MAYNKITPDRGTKMGVQEVRRTQPQHIKGNSLSGARSIGEA